MDNVLNLIRTSTSSLLDNKQFSDVELVLSGGDTILAHRYILSSLPFFEKAFKSGMKDETRIELLDNCFANKSYVLDCLRPLYSLTDCMGSLTQENLLAVRGIAQFLGFSCMVDATQEFALQHLTHETIDTLVIFSAYLDRVAAPSGKRKVANEDQCEHHLTICDELLLSSLKPRLYDLAKQLCCAIVSEKLEVSPETMLILVREKCLNVSELELLQAILKAQVHWKLDELEKRELLYMILGNIDFVRCTADNGSTTQILSLIDEAKLEDDPRILRLVLSGTQKQEEAKACIKKSRHVFKLTLTPDTSLLPSNGWYEFEQRVAHNITVPLTFTRKYQASTTRFKAKPFKKAISASSSCFILAKILNSQFDVVGIYIHFGSPLLTRPQINVGECVPIHSAALILFKRDGTISMLYPTDDPAKKREMLIQTAEPSLAMGSVEDRPHRDFYLKNTLRKIVLYPGGSFIADDPAINNNLFTLEVCDVEAYVLE